MKAIIDGYKYDTDTATFVMRYDLNRIDKAEMYRNRKYKFFSMHMIHNEDSKSLEFRYEIVPLTKVQAMNLLAETNNIDKYEELFGEIPEAEGEDYISDEYDEQHTVNEIVEDEFVIDTPHIKRSPAASKVIHRVQRKLSHGCRNNDHETVKACLTCGAAVRHKHINQAVVNSNFDILCLLLDSFSLRIKDKTLRLAVLMGDLDIFKVLIECRKDYIDQALILSKKYLIVEIVKYLEGADENTIARMESDMLVNDPNSKRYSDFQEFMTEKNKP